MRIGNLNREKNGWQFQFSIGAPVWRLNWYPPQIMIAFLKLLRHDWPVGEYAMRGRDFKGFIWEYVLPLPDIILHSFRNPLKAFLLRYEYGGRC